MGRGHGPPTYDTLNPLSNALVLVLVLWVFLSRGRVYYHSECNGKFDAEAFLLDP